MTELLPAQVDRLEQSVDNHDVRIGRVEDVLYGTERPQVDGVVAGMAKIESQLSRIVVVIWALLGISLILLMTVAMAVLS